MSEKEQVKVNSEDKKIRAAERDLLFGSLLIIACIVLAIYAHKMNLEAIRIASARYFTAPGFFILIIAIGIFIMSVYLVMHALKNGGNFRWLIPAKLIARLKADRAIDTVLVFIYLFVYTILLWENIPFTRIKVPFWLNTMIFMNAIMFTFKVAKPVKIVIISAATAIAVHVIFRYLIGVPLP